MRIQVCKSYVVLPRDQSRGQCLENLLSQIRLAGAGLTQDT